MRREVYNPGDDNRVDDRGDQDARRERRLATRVAELETEVRLLGQSLAPQQVPEPKDDETAAPVQRDARWHCSKCGYLLAFYDVEQDVLRTRYKEHIVFMRAGVGGFIQIVCRGCSQVNTQEYVESEDDQDVVGD